jgi:hypothetical protein
MRYPGHPGICNDGRVLDINVSPLSFDLDIPDSRFPLAYRLALVPVLIILAQIGLDIYLIVR